MIFSQTIEYALRAMAQITSLHDGEAVTSMELSPLTGIPTHYLSKILRKLVAAGLLASVKGHHGGFRLARPAEAIRFQEVLAAFDGDCDPTRCAFGWGRCNLRNPCLLHPAFSELNTVVCEWAERSTFGTLRSPAVAVEAPARKSRRRRVKAVRR